MSRIGVKPVPVPSGVKVEINGHSVHVEGPKGKLGIDVSPLIAVSQEDGQVVCKRAGEDRDSRAMHGLTRSLIQNMIIGVSQGFEKRLEIVGVGFNASLQGRELALTVGYSNTVKVPIPEGVDVTLPDATHIVVSGADKQKVGQFAAVARAVRKPEPYKGTGIRYQGEQIRRKAGKAFGAK